MQAHIAIAYKRVQVQPVHNIQPDNGAVAQAKAWVAEIGGLKTMNIKKTAKKIVAVGAGFGLAGATMMGALAFDLADYPQQFVDDGQFDGKIVVGANAASQDIIGAIDIGASLQAVITQPGDGPSAPGVSGDAKRISEPGDTLEIGERIGSVVETLSDDDLAMLSSGSVTTRRGTTAYTQTLEIAPGTGTHGVVGLFEQRLADGSRNVGDFLRFGNQELFTYELDFTSGLRSNIETGGELRDLRDRTINMLGDHYTIAEATYDNNIVTLTLLAGDVSDTLEQGQTRTYTIDGQDYEVTVLIVGQGTTPTVRLLVNGETTDTLRIGDTDTLSDGMEIGIREIVQSSRAFEGDQGSIVEFYLGANKIVFTGNANGADGQVEIGTENINTAKVNIRATETGSQLRINSISYTLDADYAYRNEAHLAAGDGLAQFLRHPEAMLNSGWDIVYEGLSQPAKSMIEFDPRGDDEYELSFVNRRGDSFSVPYLHNPSASGTNVRFGDDTDRFVFHEVLFTDSGNMTTDTFHIVEDDYFLLSHNDGDSAGDSYVLQWTDVDEFDSILRFTHGGSGAEIVSSFSTVYNESQVEAQTSYPAASGNILLGGRSFDFWLMQDSSDDYRLAVDLNNDGELAGGNFSATTNSETVNVVTRGGGILSLGDYNSAAYTAAGASGYDAVVTLTTLEKNIDDSDDDVVTTWTFAGAGGDLDITSSVDATTYADSFFDEKPRNSDTTISVDRYGAMYYQDNPSSGPDSLVIEYPHQQVEPQVYVIGGEVSVSAPGFSGAPSQIGFAVLDRDVSYDQDNMIVVGGPCANTMAAELLGNPSDCTEGFSDGMGMIRGFDTGNNVAVLVAGSSADGRDTVESSRVLARAATQAVPNFSGDSVEVVIAGANDVSVHSAN